MSTELNTALKAFLATFGTIIFTFALFYLARMVYHGNQSRQQHRTRDAEKGSAHGVPDEHISEAQLPTTPHAALCHTVRIATSWIYEATKSMLIAVLSASAIKRFRATRTFTELDLEGSIDNGASRKSITSLATTSTIHSGVLAPVNTPSSSLPEIPCVTIAPPSKPIPDIMVSLPSQEHLIAPVETGILDANLLSIDPWIPVSSSDTRLHGFTGDDHYLDDIAIVDEDDDGELEDLMEMLADIVRESRSMEGKGNEPRGLLGALVSAWTSNSNLTDGDDEASGPETPDDRTWTISLDAAGTGGNAEG